MARRRSARRRFFAFVVALLLLLVAPVHTGRTQELVAHPDVPHEGFLPLATARAIFAMRVPIWEDGAPVRVFVLSDDSDLHVGFFKRKLKVYPHQMRQAWDRMVFSGTGMAPTRVQSEEEMKAKVASVAGAIGYLREETIDDSVRVLEIR